MVDEVKPFSLSAQILQAVRAAPMDAHQLIDRFGYGYAYQVKFLVKLGCVVVDDGNADEEGSGSVRITDKGRALCPPRNQHLLKAYYQRMDALFNEDGD